MLIKKLSASAIGDWNQCHFKFKLRILNKLPRVSQPHLEFGNMLHEVLENYGKLHKHGMLYLPFDNMLSLLNVSFQKYNHGKTFSESERVLNNYYEDIFKNKTCMIIETEKMFGIDMGKFKLTGKIDRIDKLSDSEYEVVDYKSGKVDKKKILKSDIQLLIYAFKVFTDHNFNLEKCKVSLHYLSHGVFSEIISLKEVKDFRIRLDEIYNSMVNTIEFKPRKNEYCYWCDGRSLCPLFTKQISFRPKKEIIL